MDYVAKLRGKGWDVREQTQTDAVPAAEFKYGIWYVLPHAETNSGSVVVPYLFHPDLPSAAVPLTAFNVHDGTVYFKDDEMAYFMDERDFARGLEDFETFADFIKDIKRYD